MEQTHDIKPDVRTLFNVVVRRPLEQLDRRMLTTYIQRKLSNEESQRLLHELHEIGVATRGQEKQRLLQMLLTVQRVLPMTEVIDLLLFLGLQSFATDLKYEHYGDLMRISGGCTRNLGKIRRFFVTRKSQSDQKLFHPHVLFKSEHDKLIKAIHTASPGEKQYIADKFAIITWFRVQQYEPDGCPQRREILQNMNSLMSSLPGVVDCSLAKIVFNSKMATTEEFDGNIEYAAEYIRRAKYLSEVFNDKSAKIMAHYSCFFFYRKLYLRDKTDDNRRQAMQQCSIGCDMFSDVDDELGRFCKLLFLLYKANEYLQITYEFEVLDECEADEASIKAAEDVLDCAAKYLVTSEPRRELAYAFCMGRLSQLKGNYVKAHAYLLNAKGLMNDGALDDTEKRNINIFCRRVLSFLKLKK